MYILKVIVSFLNYRRRVSGANKNLCERGIASDASGSCESFLSHHRGRFDGESPTHFARKPEGSD